MDRGDLLLIQIIEYDLPVYLSFYQQTICCRCRTEFYKRSSFDVAMLAGLYTVIEVSKGLLQVCVLL